MISIFWFLQFFIIYSFLIVLVTSKSYYSIVAPGTIKSNHKYTVVVTLHNADEPCSMRVAIKGPSFNDAQQVYVRPFESKLLEFMPQKLSSDEYKLTVEGNSGLIFKNETVLLTDPNSGPNIYIQTDKAIYKPKDLVQFRVVILDEHTRPLKIKEPIRVEILDGLDNRVKQFKDISLKKGVYTGKFSLSEYPVPGDWKIKVTISGKYAYSTFKTIKVQKYVLPKFSVYLRSPENIVLEDGSLKVGIYGKYTYDKYVAGQAIIELWDPFNNKLLQMKQLEIETENFVEFHFGNQKDFEKVDTLKIEAKLTESLTGITQSETRYVSVKNQRYNIKIPYNEIEFQNNKPYRLKAHVEHWSGAAVWDFKTPVVMQHGNKRYESYLNAFGEATFDFDHQATADHVFVYKDSQQKLPNILAYDSFAGNKMEYYCKLKLVGGSPRLGKTLEIEISSIENIPYFVYTIISHATIIRMELVTVPSNQKSFIIRVTPSIEMIPFSFLYVHYVHNGNLRYEELSLNFPQELENQISLVAPKEVGPGRDVTITIQAEPYSYVSILAVDLSVFLLDPSYDLDKNDILFGLSYDQSYIPAAGILQPSLVSGLITLTNADYTFGVILREKTFSPGINFPPKFRSRFPETWIFQDIQIQEVNTQLTLHIPDTITTWRITAFSNHDIKGIGIVNKPTDITTIQPFFISLNLPYSVKRGEIVAIPIIVFNYLNQSLDTQVTMYNDKQEFYFIASNLQETENDKQQIKQINVPFEGGKTVTFYINPIQLGEITIKISATNSMYTDGIVQKLNVEPEGIAKHHNKVMYLSVPTGEIFSSFFYLIFPEDIVPDSEYIRIAVGGDYLVPTLENFHDLVQLPTGCGEQNMVNFAPNILILQYLKVNGKLSKEKYLVQKVRSFIDIGYQQQLSFRHRNGGYSVFGERSHPEPSNWLTTYVVRYFIKSVKYSTVEARIIESDLDYLAKQQKSSGEFPRTGYLFSPTHQNEYGFTAFVLLTFLEDQKYALKHQETIQKGLQFLNSNLNNIKDIYALSIVACALKTAKDANANNVIEKLKEQSKTNPTGLMWWSGGDRNTANDVEITAYALMALLDTPGDHTPILKWLIQQRNARGGFKSTQDTVVGLQALVKFSEISKNLNNVNLSIRYHAKDREGIDMQYEEFKVEPDNVLILQQHELPKSTRHISFEAKGFGNSFIQVSYQYNVIEENKLRYFLIHPKAKLLNPNELSLEICLTYQTPAEPHDSKTNMVIMEVNLPSGFRADPESNFNIDDNELIQRIESRNSDSTIILYFDNLLVNVKNCLSFEADKISDVIKPKPAAIIVYDYYNLTRSNTEFYNVQK